MHLDEDGFEVLDKEDLQHQPDDPRMTELEADYYLNLNRKEIDQLLALNPATPVVHLDCIAELHPRLVLRNPVLQTLMLEDPGRWSEILDAVARGLRWEAEGIDHYANKG